MNATTSTQKPGLLLAEDWDESIDPAGYWLSEKLDGVRALWNGSEFLSRTGRPFAAPAWFSAGLPPWQLDGELFLGRGRFAEANGIVARKQGGEAWRPLRFVVFDAPQAAGGFERRQEFLQAEWPAAPHARRLPHDLCYDREHLARALQKCEDDGGEGLMLRLPGSPYVAGRSSMLLKVKRWRDAEAIVVGHEAGKGRNAGRLGALACQLDSGVRFSLGSGLSDAERNAPPKLGSKITFRFQEWTAAGKPRCPSFVRMIEVV